MRIVLGATVAAFLACGTANSAELRFGHFLPALHPLQEGLEEWAAKLEEESGGAISMSFFPGAQLGAANDHYDMANSGVVDFAWIAIGYTPGKFPIGELLDVPFAIPGDPQVANRALNEWYAPFAEQEMPEVKLCFVHLMPSGYLHTKFEVKTPDQATGLRIRPASAAVAAYFTNLGNTTVPMAVTEAQQAIERGVADSLSLAYNSVVLYGIDRSLNYHLDLPLYYPGGAVVMNRATYDRLSESEKAAVDKYCSGEGSVIASQRWHEWEAEGRQIMEEKGGHFFYVPAEEEAVLWQEAAAPVLDQWRGLVSAAGHNPDELLSDLYDRIDTQE